MENGPHNYDVATNNELPNDSFDDLNEEIKEEIK
jgi:hypothetical protein